MSQESGELGAALRVQEGVSNPLDALSIPIPCQASWADMKGDERMRFCAQCRLHVYNLSEMTRKEAEALVQAPDGKGKVCVRLYRRPDGTVLTRSCRAARRLRRLVAVAASFIAAAVVGFFLWASGQATAGLYQGGVAGVKAREPFRTVVRWIEGPAPVPPMVMGQSTIIMGKMVAPPPPPGN